MARHAQLKDYFGRDLAVRLADKIQPLYTKFDNERFINQVGTAVDSLALKQRVAAIADALHRQLPRRYTESIEVFLQILGPENKKETGMFTKGYWLMPLAFYIEKYGTDAENFDVSMEAIEAITKRNTGEYAIRPFLVRYPERTIRVMQKWSTSPHFHVRRLSSEGLRPRLPWTKRITTFSKNPFPIIDILENLKADPSAYVRRSVANNFNDLLKENYSFTIAVIRRWSIDAPKETRWIVKHALRNQIKSKNKEALQIIESTMNKPLPR